MSRAIDQLEGGLKIIVPTEKSRDVKFSDLWRVLKDGLKIKLAMIRPFQGKYPEAASVSHCQIAPKDPLRFFVVGRPFAWHFGSRLLPIRTIINPKITWRSEGEEYIREGCMSFPFTNTRKIKRAMIVRMEYWTFFGPRKHKFYEFRAAMCQHELDHFEGITIEDRHKNRYKK